jgi:hypothetical protein
MDRFVTRTAQGFDVIEGHLLNDRPLSRAEADRLAKGSPEPRRKPFPEDTVSAAPHEKGASQGPPLPPAQSAPQPARPAVINLGTTRADAAGGSAGFRIKGSPTW